MEKEIVALTKKLVSFKTTEDRPEELKKCINFVASYFKGSGCIVKKYMSNNKPSIVILTKNTKKPEIMFNGHLDVVAAGIKDFSPKIKGTRMYGRGTRDMKGSAAVMMLLMKKFAKQKKSIGLMLTSDEEIGGLNGVKFLVKKGYKPKFVLVADGPHALVTKEKGILRLTVSATGKSAHGAMLWDGENAIEKLMIAYLKMKKMFPKTTKKNRWKETMNLGIIKGGDIINKVPDYAEIKLDIRYTEKSSPQKILKKLKRVKGVKFETGFIGSFLNSNKNSPYIKRLNQSAKKITKKKLPFSHQHGSTDARYFSESGVQCLVSGPKGGGNIHAENEYVEINGLVNFYKILEDFI